MDAAPPDPGSRPSLDVATFARMVDHTLLKPEATREQILAVCDEALELATASVCVNGLWVATVAERLASSEVRTCSVVGFPLGATSPAALAAETVAAVADGAREIDMVIPVGMLRSGDDAGVVRHVQTVRAEAPGLVVKAILESAVLDDAELRRACELSVDAGADFVKTSTGFNPAGGATQAAVALMRATVGPAIGVKASGGIRTLDDVQQMLAAGASRLGMSATTEVADAIRAAQA